MFPKWYISGIITITKIQKEIIFLLFIVVHRSRTNSKPMIIAIPQRMMNISVILTNELIVYGANVR